MHSAGREIEYCYYQDKEDKAECRKRDKNKITTEKYGAKSKVWSSCELMFQGNFVETLYHIIYFKE